MDEGESETCPFAAVGLAAVEGLEDVLLVFLRNAGSVVLHLQRDASQPTRETDGDPAPE